MRAFAAIAIFACFAQAASCGPSLPRDKDHRQRLDWRALKGSCEVGADKVTCDKQSFRSAVIAWIECWDRERKCQAQLELSGGLAEIDRAVCEGQVAACRAKLEDPWRSPWLWGLLGVAAGMAAGVGIGLGAR